jgi:LPXTG-motif cell wall-anchored protein
MRKLTILAILALLGSGIAVAQSPQDLGNTSAPGVTFVTGVVVSSNNDHIILRNDMGELVTVFLDSSTVGAKDRSAGTRIKVNYHLEEARAIADEIIGFQGDGPAPAPLATTPPVKVSQSPIVEPPPPVVEAPPAVAPEPLPPPAPVAEVPEPEPVESPAYDVDDSPEALPATASNQSLIALAGLLALGAAIVVRRVVR